MAKAPVTKLHPKLQKFHEAIEKRTKVRDVFVTPSFRQDCINTGSTVINMLIGGSRLPDGSFICPGWPRGTIIEIFGRESSGKSTLALTAMAQAINNGGANDGCGLYVDLECAVKDYYAMKLGVDFRPVEIGGPGRAVRAQPHTFEETEALVMCAVLNGVDLVVVDSVAGLISGREIKRDVSDEKQKLGVAEIPRLMSGWMPKLQSIIARTKSTVIFLNQTRDKIGAKGYTEEALKSTTGGNALKFWTSIRMILKPKFSTKASIFNPITREKEDVQIATDIECKLLKNKIDAKQGHSGIITLRYGVGVDELRTMLNVAEAYKLIKKNGSYYEFSSSKTGEVIKEAGMEKFRLSISRNQDVLDDMIAQCTNFIVQGYKTIDEETLSELEEGAVTKKHEDEEDEYEEGAGPEVEHIGSVDIDSIMNEGSTSDTSDDASEDNVMVVGSDLDMTDLS
jgi:recombination protein RecA